MEVMDHNKINLQHHPINKYNNQSREYKNLLLIENHTYPNHPKILLFLITHRTIMKQIKTIIKTTESFNQIN